MKSLLVALGLVIAAPIAAQAQIVIQAPQIPGITVPAHPRDDYWRYREGEREPEWRRREEYREAEHQREDWQRAHCVRDYRNEEYCRR